MVVLAEDHKYTEKKLRADFGFTGTDGDIAIELKVESKWQVDSFLNAVGKDVSKVDELGKAGVLIIVARAKANLIESSFVRMTVGHEVGEFRLLVYSPVSIFDEGL